jgi:small-conductance mechanosensitive channel
MRVLAFKGLLLLSLTLLVGAAGAMAQDAEAPPSPADATAEAYVNSAPVVIDGRSLFSVRGISTYPADRRADEVAGRIRALARDPSFDPSTIEISHEATHTRIGAAARPVLRITDADAESEEIDRRLFAEVCLGKIREAIIDYRAARTREALISSAWHGVLATALAALAFGLALRLVRALTRWTHRRLAERVKSVTVRSFEVVRAERIRTVIDNTLRVAGGLALVVIVFVYVRYVLGLVPWTHGAAAQIDGWVLAPIAMLGSGIVTKLPDLVFLIVLFFVVRYALRLIELFFSAVGRGDVKLESFDPEWSQPTFKILRVAVIAFAVIVAYPYIPGSSSAAFKGVTLFMGVVFSLGSSSAISNIVAGYTMIYRRAFHEGDVVKIGDVTGRVTQVRVQVTHLRTIKNEEVIVPNSTIMGNEVVNYSSLAKSDGLILHTTVGIGYETPWRQVEAMLLDAAERTTGLLKEPKPFVLATALGDFAITYQINAYCNEPTRMLQLYSDLHRSILDVFNEHGVQIMTPAYEGDPEEPKVVPKDRWQWPPPAKT